MDDSELLNLPEDEYDALNDETFGDDAGAEYNWEENQAIFGDFLGSDLPNGGKQKAPAGGGSDYEEAEPVTPTAKVQEEYILYERQTRETEYDEFENENALEESISRLVMDEFDDDEEAVANEKLRRITATKSSYYFMPPQVVNRNLQWFMEKELPGGNSLLGSSVWSMHPTSISTRSEAIDNSGLSASYELPKSSIGSERRDVGSAASAGGHLMSDLGNLLGLGMGKMPNVPSAQAPPVLGTKPPTFKTVDEIEQELLRELEAAKVPARPAAPEEAKPSQPRPKIMSLEELEKQLIQESSAPKSSAEASQPPASQTGRPTPSSQLPSVHPDMNRGPQRGPGMVAPGMPGQLPIPASMAATQASANPNAYLMQRAMAGRPHPRPVGFPPQNNFAQNIMNSAAAQAAMHQLQLRQQTLRFLQMNASGQFFNAAAAAQALNMRKMPFGMPVPQPQPNHIPSHGQRRQDIKTDNGDAGLMTEKDKQRLKNIQIVQLQNDHPHTTDYYCLMRKVRKGGNGQPPMDVLKTLFPKKSDEDDSNKRHYEPAHFENSLGKLQAQSALAPKKAIDTVIRVVDTGPTAGKKKSYRYLLLEIEKMYECLLALEEGDLRVVLDTHGEEGEEELRKTREKVVAFLNDAKKLSEVMTVKKGKVLVCRLAALIDQPARMVALRHVFKTFPSWAISPSTPPGSSELIELFPYIRHCVLNMDAHTLETLCVELEDDVYNTMVTTKLGVSMIMVLLHRGEKLIRSPQASDQLKAIWSKTVYKVLAALLRNKQIVTPPVELYLVGLQRLLTSDLHRLNQHVTEELSKLLTGFLNAGAKQIKQDY